MTGRAAPAKRAGGSSKAQRVGEVLEWLERRGTKRDRDGMARFGIVAKKAFGVPVGTLQQLARRLGRDHELALALWQTGWYEARMLTAFVDEPARVTAAQMDRWARDFDSWALVDTLCMHLFDRTPHAWAKVRAWSTRRGEYQKRAAFALLASLALHDKQSPDGPFEEALALLERAAADGRNFVKKGVSWALRSIGRRSPALYARSVALARRLAESEQDGARWVGREALRDLDSAALKRRLAPKRPKAAR